MSAITLLTSDDLREPNRENTVLAKLNETITEVNSVGTGTDLTPSTVTVRTDSTTVTRPLVVNNRGINSSTDGVGIELGLAAGQAAAVAAVQIDALSENTTFTGAAADGTLSIKVALNGTPTERLSITSAGLTTVTGALVATGALTIGGSSALGDGTADRTTITGANDGINSPANGVLDIYDATVAAQGVGGQIVFRGNYTASDPTMFGAITAYKESATVDGSQYGAAMVFNTRAQGGNNTEKMRIASDGTITMAGPLDHNGSTVGFFGTAPHVQETITGTVITATNGTAMAQLLTALANLGLIVNSSSNV